MLETSKGLCDLLGLLCDWLRRRVGLDRVCLESGGRFVGEMGLYPVKLASLPFLLLYNIALMLHVESDGQIVECVLCLFSVLDGVSQSLEIGSDQFRFS